MYQQIANDISFSGVVNIQIDLDSKNVIFGGVLIPAFFILSCAAGAVKNLVKASLEGAVAITTILLGVSIFEKASAVIPDSFRAWTPVANPDIKLSTSTTSKETIILTLISKLPD